MTPRDPFLSTPSARQSNSPRQVSWRRWRPSPTRKGRSALAKLTALGAILDPIVERQFQDADASSGNADRISKFAFRPLKLRDDGRAEFLPARVIGFSVDGQEGAALRRSAAAVSIAFCSFLKARTSIWRTRSRDTP